MAKKLDQKEMVSFEELLNSQIIINEALINLLDRKGVLSKQEIIEEIRAVKAGLAKEK
jgi:hypothetical protein